MNGMKRDPIVIHLDEAGLRLDKWLSIRLPEHSREFWKQRILKGEVTVNGKKVNPSRPLIENDQIEFSIEVEETKVTPAAEPLTLKLLYEDEWFFVVDKPAGLVVNPAHGHASGTLADALGAMYPKGLSDLSGKDRQGIVHRLDKDTSGAMLIARDNDTHEKLAKLFREQTIDRIYDAVAWGMPASLSGRIDAPIIRGDVNRKKMVVKEDGKEAKTDFRVLSQKDDMTHLECRLLTGRTHQIRVHLAYIGHPVVGDRLYGGWRKGLALEYHLLHARGLAFTHPVTGEAFSVNSPLPSRFYSYVRREDL
ncbi:MAG: RluA family pseudouridine synthase [Eubacteriales bacterium]|nr:RluA family pseudouridine synthase [Eubacteriales bacterium]